MIGSLRIRWSEHEARKPYARPFGVSFVDDGGFDRGSVAVSGADLLYLRQFQTAVLALAGELFDDPALRDAPDPQRAWLDTVCALLPAATQLRIKPESSFDHDAGRIFHFVVRGPADVSAVMDAPRLLEYQDFQAVLAHASGHLYRNLNVEAIDDHNRRQRAWMVALDGMLARPDAAEAMTEEWPWR